MDKIKPSFARQGIHINRKTDMINTLLPVRAYI